MNAQTEVRKNEKCDSQDVESKIFNMLWTLRKQGAKERSIETYEYYLRQLKKHDADLQDPESVKDVIARQEWNDNTKALAVASYSARANFSKSTMERGHHQNTKG